MKSLFNIRERDEALESLATDIVDAAKNCTIVIKKIGTICQAPENFSNPQKLIDKRVRYLFSNYFHDHIEELTSANLISIEQQEELANSFFTYLCGLTPFLYEGKVISSPGFSKPKRKFKWTADDYKELKVKLVYKWFYSEWNKWDHETRIKYSFKLESGTQKVVNAIVASSKAKSSLWMRQRKIDDIVSPDNLMRMVLEVMPSYKYQYQVDLYKMYTENFVRELASKFEWFSHHFYQYNTYLNKYFQWTAY